MRALPACDPIHLNKINRPFYDPALIGSNWIAVSGQKGGVGKTTTCLSLGGSMAEQGRHVLLVDLDPQANLTQALGVDPEKLQRSVGDVLLKKASLVEVSRETAIMNMDLVPANRGLILVEKKLHTTRESLMRLKSCLTGMQYTYYDIVLIDCPPSFGPLTVNALVAVGLVIIPLTCDFYSLQSLQMFIKMLETLSDRMNPNQRIRMLVTQLDTRTLLSRLFLGQMRLRYKEFLFDTMIRIDVRLRESPLFGSPVNSFAPKTRSALEYRALSRELLQWLEEEFLIGLS